MVVIIKGKTVYIGSSDPRSVLAPPSPAQHVPSSSSPSQHVPSPSQHVPSPSQHVPSFAQHSSPPGPHVLSPGYVVVEGDSIVAVYQVLPSHLNTTSMIEADIVCPGFIDIHTHGIGGATDLLEYWLHDFTFKTLPSYGCTSILASITFPKDYAVSRQVIQTLKQRVDVALDGQAVLAGIHAEGPIVSDCGGLPHSHADSMSLDEFKQILQELGTALKVMTISPTAEARFGFARLKALLDHGAVPALGHDKNATEDDIIGALRVCGTHVPPVRPHITHMFNVSSFQHRLPSLANFGMLEQLPNEPLYEGLVPPTVEVIGDLVHVSPLTITSVLSCRIPNHVAFITDAVIDYHACSSIQYAGTQISVKPITHGKQAAVLHGTSTIAGSCTNMFRIFQNLVQVLRVPMDKAIQMVSDTPAKIARIDARVGSLEVGKRADILLINADLNLKATIIAGKVAYTST